RFSRDWSSDVCSSDLSGQVNGLRAKGGFELVEIEWKEAKVTKVVIKSTLGGNLRLRAPNALTLSNGEALPAARGENTNPFYFLRSEERRVGKEGVYR